MPRPTMSLSEISCRTIYSSGGIGRGAEAPRPSINEVHPWNRETIIRIGTQLKWRFQRRRHIANGRKDKGEQYRQYSTWVCGPGYAGPDADPGVRAWVRTWVRGPLARIDGEYRAWSRRSYRGARDEAPIRHILSEQQIGRGAAAPRPSIDEVHPWNCETIIRIGTM